MQTYDFKFDPLLNLTSTLFMADADLFVYESASPVLPSVDGANLAVYIKPDNGTEIRLKPGQRFRLSTESHAKMWAVRLADPTVTLQAAFIIGSGEFDDANTLNKFKLDATFANNVSVTNDAAHAVPVSLPGTAITNTTANRVPVALDVTATQNVSIVGTVNVAGTTVNYTNAYSDATLNATVTLITPAQNPNGLYIEYAEFSGAGTMGAGSYGMCTLLAKTSVPTTATDGDVLMITTVGNLNGTSTTPSVALPHVNDRLGVRVKVPAGKGVYLNTNADWSRCTKTVLVTIL